ncbi:SGNH/GDSL hydrolase family protein [Treponema socranskii]|uniref:SGNH/GDSL hydrolase family protein n=1 Tax=Treponema socranskii TaxID=53419 RepID=UPI003D6DE445
MENGIHTIAVWGDSILKGAVTGYSESRFDILEEENSLALAQKKLGFTLINKSVFGNIINKALRTLKRDMEKGLSCDLGIVESGGNDCDYDWTPISENPDAPHKPRNPLPDFLHILDEAVETLRAYKITPLLMTMPPLVPDRWYKTITSGQNKKNIDRFLDGDIFRLYRAHELYSLSIEKYALSHSVRYIDMRMAMLETKDYRSLMCEDGIHPNASGYAYMADVWIRELPRLHKEF